MTTPLHPELPGLDAAIESIQARCAAPTTLLRFVDEGDNEPMQVPTGTGSQLVTPPVFPFLREFTFSDTPTAEEYQQFVDETVTAYLRNVHLMTLTMISRAAGTMLVADLASLDAVAQGAAWLRSLRKPVGTLVSDVHTGTHVLGIQRTAAQGALSNAVLVVAQPEFVGRMWCQREWQVQVHGKTVNVRRDQSMLVVTDSAVRVHTA